MGPSIARSVTDWRRVPVPLVVLTCPPLFLAHRELSACGTPAGCSSLALAGALLAALAGVPAAALVARLASGGRLPRWLAPAQDGRALAALAGIVVAVDAYILASLLDAVPPAADALASPVGLVLALPLVVVQVLVVAAGTVVGEPPFAVRVLAVAVGVGLSAAWWAVLAAGVGRLVAAVGRRMPPANEPRD